MMSLVMVPEVGPEIQGKSNFREKALNIFHQSFYPIIGMLCQTI
jgi:hypothetical protein